jgi:Ca2+-binding RTX toxin-like protein
MAAAQAAEFDSRWYVVAQEELGDGFSATLFEMLDDRQRRTGEKVIGIRGSETSNWGIDYLTGLVNIGILGSQRGMLQYESLERFYRDLVAAGKLGQEEEITLAGHSLGGFLVQAFAAKHASLIRSAYTYNSPGFKALAWGTNVHTQLLEFFGITDASIPGAKIVNVRAVEGLSLTAGLGQMVGPVQPISIEEGGARENHSIVTLTDALAVSAVLAELAPSLTVSVANSLLRAASERHENSLELLLDSARKLLLGPYVDITVTNDRGLLHTNLQAFTQTSLFQQLAGGLRVDLSTSTAAAKARGDFSAFATFLTLNPILISTTTGVAQAQLNAAFRDAWGDTFAAWEADRSMSVSDRWLGKETFTDAWIRDRAAMLDWVVLRNTKDIEGLIIASNIGRPISRPVAYEDRTTGTQIVIGAVNLNQRAQVIFGDTRNNELSGFGKDDRLYGGGGEDLLIGRGGADYLEGGEGDDVLEGGDGDDVLLGGRGNDKYVFEAGWGKDTLVDADGVGQLTLNGQVLSGGVANGTRDVWLEKLAGGEVIRYEVQDSSRSFTGHQLVISAQGSSANSITVNHFDLEQAVTATGYLGIRLDNTPQLVVAGSTTPQLRSGNPFQVWDFDPHTFSGSSAIATSSSFTVYLKQAAKAGEKLVLRLQGIASDAIKAVLGDDIVDAEGAVIALREGQTDLSFALFREAAAGEAQIGSLAVHYQRDSEHVVSNSWELEFGASPHEYDATFTGDDPTRSSIKDNLTGSLGRDLLQGLGGEDALLGFAGDDRIDGGPGNDLLMGGLGADVLTGGDGDDFIYGSSSGGILLVGVEPLLPGFAVLAEGLNWRITTDGGFDERGLPNWYLSGSVSRDQQMEDAGNTADGGAGNDWILAGTGDDFARGGEGNDLLIGMAGADVLLGEGGDDILVGDGPHSNPQGDLVVWTPGEQHGTDFLDGGDGNDALYGQGGNDVLFGGAGQDELWGDDFLYMETPQQYHGDDWLDGEAGNDTLIGGGGEDTVYGGTGNDTLWGDGGIFMPTDPRYLEPTYHGDDYLEGEDGDDILIGQAGNDTLYGGPGADLLFGDDSPLRLPGQFHGDDYMDGDDGDDTLVGGGGNDVLYGSGGNDVLFGDDTALESPYEGDDWLDGEEGDDRLFGGGGKDTLYGGSGHDLLRGGEGDDWLDGEDGEDLLGGDAGADMLFGGVGNDELQGGEGDDELDGGDGDDRLYGEEGNDLLFGGTGNDVLYGGEGDDYLDGGGGDDILDGGGGNDVLVGGGGRDSYILRPGAGHSTVVANSDVNTVVLTSGLSLDTITAGVAAAGGVQLTFGNGQQLTVHGESWFQIGQTIVGHGELVQFIEELNATAPSAPIPGTVPVRTVTNLYDADGKVTGSSVHVVELSGAVNTTTYTGEDGTGEKLSQTWLRLDGARGDDVFNGDGSSTGNAYYVDGRSSRYADDGQGNRTQTTYDAQGQPIARTWTQAEGSWGGDLYASYGNSSGFVHYPNGTHSAYTIDSEGRRRDTWYDVEVQVMPVVSQAALPDGGYQQVLDDGLGNVTTTVFSTLGVRLEDRWVRASGSHGTTTYDSDGSSTGSAYFTDGSYSSIETDLDGKTLTRNYDWRGEFTGSTIRQSHGFNTITSFLNAVGVKIRESWTQLDGAAGDDIIGPLDFNGLYNLAALSRRPPVGDELTWITGDGASGSSWNYGSRYGGEWHLPWNGAASGYAGSYEFDLWDGNLARGWSTIGSDDFAVELWFGTAWYAEGHETPSLVTTGDSRFFDREGKLDLSLTQSFDGTKRLYFDYWGDSVPGALVATASNQTPWTSTFELADGMYTVLKDDGLGNALTTRYGQTGVKLADMWFHNDGSGGMNIYRGDGTRDGLTSTPQGRIVRFSVAPSGELTIADFPGADAVVRQFRRPPAAEVNVRPQPQALGVPPTGGEYQAIVIRTDGNGGSSVRFDGKGTADIIRFAGGQPITFSSVDTDPGFRAATVLNETIVGWNYDIRGLPISRYVDDRRGRVETQHINALGGVSGRSVVATEEDGSVKTFNYDAAGDLIGSSIEQRLVAGQSLTLNYDARGKYIGKTLNVTDGRGNSALSRYDAAGVVVSSETQVVTADHETVITRYADGGAPSETLVTSVSPDGLIRTHYYDGSGRYTGSIEAIMEQDARFTTGIYDESGILSSYVVLFADGEHDTFITSYDGGGRRVHQDVLDAGGSHSSTRYRPDGSSIKTHFALDGSYTKLERDTLGDIVITHYDSGGTRLTDSWVRGDGATGSNVFRSDGTVMGRTAYSDGRSSTFVSDDRGNKTVSHYGAHGEMEGRVLTGREGDAVRTVVFDSQGLQRSEWVTIVSRVDGEGNSRPNRAPALMKPLEEQHAEKNIPFSFSVPEGTFVDLDPGDHLSYSARLESGAPLPSWLQFDPATLTFSGTPLYSDLGSISVWLTATDAYGATTSGTFVLTVANRNTAPMVVHALHAQSAAEDEPWSFVLPASTFTDADTEDVLTYSARLSDGAPLPEWLMFDAVAGRFSGTPRNSDVTHHSVQVTATDAGGLMAIASFDLAVLNVNDVPTLASRIADQQATQDAPWLFTIPAETFTDEDVEDRLSFAAALADRSALPPWLAFDVDSATFSGLPGNDAVGMLKLVVTATDAAGAQADVEFQLEVVDINDAPVAVGSLADWVAVEGGAASYTLTAGAFADPDWGDALRYHARLSDGALLPEWLVFDNASMTFTATPPFSGSFGLEVIATDHGELSASHRFNLHVQAAGRSLRGTNRPDTLVGGPGDDHLDGLGGADVMRGGPGNDTYYVDNPADSVVERADEGVDTAISSVSYGLPANVENVTLTGKAALTSWGNELANVLVGNSGANVLIGWGGDDLLDGGAEEDVLVGGTGNDTYLLGRGYGADRIVEADATPGNTDVLQFGSLIAADQLWFSRKGLDLYVSVVGTADSMTISGWFLGAAFRVEEFRTSEGRSLQERQVQALVDAMAAFAPPAAGQTTLAIGHQNALGGVIAASWQ